jgi:AIPR protein
MALDQITKALVGEFLAEAGIRSKTPEVDFELFVAHTLVGPHIDGPIDFENVMTGAGGDTGFDAVAIVINGELVTDVDSVAELAANGTTLDVQYMFVQAKTSNSFSTSDVGTIEYGVKDFFSATPSLARNEAIAAAAELSQKVLEQARLFRNSNPICSVYYATAGRWLDDPDLSARVSSAQSEIDGLNLFSKVSFVPLDARAVQKRYHNLKTGSEREFTFQNRIPLPDIDNVSESHIGFIPARDLLAVLADEDGTLSSNVFYENVRDYQGESNVVNAGIRETLTSERRSLFPLMNNGITIIAKGMRQTGTKFVIQDFQVVNGCQTCNVLWANDGDLDDTVLVPLRLISTDNEDVILDVIRATNRQTEVKEEQFFASSDYLKQLELYFESASPDQALYLERRSKQYANSSVERTRIVPFNSLIRSFASIVLNEPHRATRNYKQVLARIPDDILNPSHRPSVYFAAASSLYRLDFLFRNGALDRKFSPAKFHLLLATRLLIDKSVPRHLNAGEADQWAQKLIDAYWNQVKAEGLFKQAAKDIETLAAGDLSRDRIRTAPFTEQVLSHYGA